MNNRKDSVTEFLEQKEIAVIGASRNRFKYGYLAFQMLRSNNYIVYPVNPSADYIDGITCYSDIASLPDSVTAAFIITPLCNTANMVSEAIKKGITHIWIQQNAETDEAIKIAEKNNINLVKKICLFMNIDNRKTSYNAEQFIKKYFDN